MIANVAITVGSLYLAMLAGHTEFQKVCGHSHNVKREDCDKLKGVLED